jgi:hypothetical protein
VCQYAYYLTRNPAKILTSVSPIAASIPVLFFISVYALYITAAGNAQNAKSELQQEQILEEVVNNQEEGCKPDDAH